jgi:chromosome segregation ATPase
VKRIKTVDVAHRTDERYQAEARKLQDDLAAMTARARTAETLLADSRECLVIRIAEAEKLARDLATANESSRDLERKCQDLQDQLAAREMRLREAEKSRQTLMAKTYKLLDSYQSRDRALTRAEEKIKQLDQWIVRLEAQARRNVNEANSVIAVTQPQPSTEIVLSAEDPREIKRRKWMELARELAKLSLKRHVQHPVVEHLQAISTPSLLAGTITY